MKIIEFLLLLRNENFKNVVLKLFNQYFIRHTYASKKIIIIFLRK